MPVTHRGTSGIAKLVSIVVAMYVAFLRLFFWVALTVLLDVARAT